MWYSNAKLLVATVVTISLPVVKSFSNHAVNPHYYYQWNPLFRNGCAFHYEGVQQTVLTIPLQCRKKCMPKSTTLCFTRLKNDDEMNQDGTTTLEDDICNNDHHENCIDSNDNSKDTKMIETIAGNNDDNTQNINKSTINSISSLSSFIHVLVDTFQMLKQSLYAKIRQLWVDLVTLVQRSMKRTTNWIQNDEMGQLISSALGLIGFFASVAAFAVWNIELLGGKKFSGPTNIIVPVVQLPTTSSGGGSSADIGNDDSQKTIKFQKPKWKTPQIRTSYSSSNKEEESSAQ